MATDTATLTVYISIGNSDDKLSQKEWAAYIRQVSGLVQRVESIYGGRTHGVWASLPYSEFQNACWCIEIEPAVAGTLKPTLARYAAQFRQDSIAWAEATMHFIGPMMPAAVVEDIAEGKRCPRCGNTAVLGRWDVCGPCAKAEGWDVEAEVTDGDH